MATVSLLATGFIMNVIAVLFVLCAVVLVLIILIQKGKGGGFSGALGGGMASGILGSKTGDFLTWVTIGLVAAFLFLAVIMAKFYKPVVHESQQAAPVQQQQPAETETVPVDITETEAGSVDTNLPGE